MVSMIKETIHIRMKNGLHARPAAQFVKGLHNFRSDVEYERGGKKLNAKSVLNMMGASLKEGDTVPFVVRGPDERETMMFIRKFLEDGEMEPS